MTMASFNDFVHKYNLKNKATSKITIQHFLSSLSSNDVAMYFRDEPFQCDIGIAKLHPSKRTHWVAYINENYFDTYGCSPQKLSKFLIRRSGYCFHSEYKIQGLTNKRDSYCASFCLFKIYQTKVIGIGFKSDVLYFYYQLIE